MFELQEPEECQGPAHHHLISTACCVLMSHIPPCPPPCLPACRHTEGDRPPRHKNFAHAVTFLWLPLIYPRAPININQSPPAPFIYIIFFFGNQTRSALRILKGSCEEPSPDPARNTGILIFCLEMGACRSCRCKQNRSSFSRPFLPKPAILGRRRTEEFSPLLLLTIRYLKMFTLRIKSPSGLESVVHSQLLLFGGASSELALEGCFAAPWPGKAAHGQSPRVQSGTAAGKLGK